MRHIAIVIAASVLLVACEQPANNAKNETAQQPATPPTQEPAVPARNFDIAQLRRGAEVYEQNCAACHGVKGEGAPNWRQRDANDRFPPPPLTGGGHTWHHPLSALRYTIRHGTQAIGGSMPAWKDKLSDADINAVIAWFQSQWPDEAYAAWYDIDQRARKRKQ